MRLPPHSISLMLMLTPFSIANNLNADKSSVHRHYRHFLPARAVNEPELPTTSPSTVTSTTVADTCTDGDCVTAIPPFVEHSCDAVSGGIFARDLNHTAYTIICDIDFPAQDIYPFILAGSFDKCLEHCEDYNEDHNDTKCAGFLFAPDRVKYSNDCYLKSSLNNPFNSSIRLLGAIVVPAAFATSNGHLTESSSFDEPLIEYTRLLGASTNNPTRRYVKHDFTHPIKLSSSELVPGINPDLITKYPMSNDTGSWTSELYEVSPIKKNIADMSIQPRLSRDGGKGGTINGTHLFIFCDTANFNGDEMVDFVSSSVAVDEEMNGLIGKPLSLVDQIGQWQDDVGRMRGFAPMTAGEQSFNKGLSGDGYRYAIWPESSLISVNQTHALMYAPLVYDEVDMETQEANFTTIGNTLLVISVDPEFGPHAERLVPQLFKQNEITYGSLGGVRAWGKSGVGGNDGEILLFGQVPDGVFVAKTTPNTYADLSSYLYWDGLGWSNKAPNIDNREALLIDKPVMDIDVIYVPFFHTFIMVYLTPFADNTFWFRGLNKQLKPTYVDGGTSDYAESILFAPWSQDYPMFKAPVPPEGFIYAGGVHQGYFGKDDIANGGLKWLLSWTEHTGQDASSEVSGYAHKTAAGAFRDGKSK